MKKACVIGCPISHSLSPIIHNYWLKKYGIEGEYSAIEVKPEDLEDFIMMLGKNGFAGCNITLPHKEAAWQVVSKFSGSPDDEIYTLPNHVAHFMRAINTIVIDQNHHFVATNTDFIGFARNLIECQPNYDYQNSIAFIIGAGGAAKAIAFALASMNVAQIVITNRSIEKAFAVKDMMVQHFNYQEEKFNVIEWGKRSDVIASCNLVVNATSLGMKGQPPLEIDLSALPENSLVTDIVYTPLETPFLAQAKANGAIVVDGLGMLIHQAAPGFEAWFGVKPEIDDDLRQEVIKHLQKRP